MRALQRRVLCRRITLAARWVAVARRALRCAPVFSARAVAILVARFNKLFRADRALPNLDSLRAA